VPISNIGTLKKLSERKYSGTLLDGSERAINRPKYEQEEYYSGKKRNTR
jgi:hypothetical protein